jgi:hypothetical protein
MTPYHAALHDLKQEHDADLVQLIAQLHTGEVAYHTFAMRKLGIARRFKRDAERLMVQYGKDQS